jgi:CDGSH-type Zn-finger protein
MRLIKKTAHGPHEIKGEGGKPIIICMCGLSKNQPFCDQSHLKTLDEDENKCYCYGMDQKREECDCKCCKQS